MQASEKKIDHAVACFTEPMDTPEQMVTLGEKYIPAIKNSPQTTAGSEVHTNVTDWEADHKLLVTANKKVVDADLAAEQARIDQAAAHRRCKGRARGCLNAITVQSDGSKDAVSKFGVAVAERNESPMEEVPENLHALKPRKLGEARWGWKVREGHHGFTVQYATNPDDPATYSPPIHWTRGRFELAGQPPASTAYLRVAACDVRLPGGQTAFTKWIAATAGI